MTVEFSSPIFLFRPFPSHFLHQQDDNRKTTSQFNNFQHGRKLSTLSMKQPNTTQRQHISS